MSKPEQIREFVGGRIAFLLVDSPASKAALAKLRRGAGKSIIESTESWEFVLDGIPEDLQGRDGPQGFEPSDAEIAIHTALTLFAVHQQGNSSPVSLKGTSFAGAMRELALSRDSNPDGIKRRFDAIITASGIDELAHHARGVVQLMGSDGQRAFDYPQFARDLYLLQNPDWRGGVILRWGQDFYSGSKDESNGFNKDIEAKEM